MTQTDSAVRPLTFSSTQPLDGRTAIFNRNWHEIALEDRKEFELGLQESDMGTEQAMSALSVRDAVSAEIASFKEEIAEFYRQDRAVYAVTPAPVVRLQGRIQLAK